MKTALLALALASPAVAQTLTLLPSACGSTSYVNCNNVQVAEGGSVWLHFPLNGSGFVQFSDADGITGTASGQSFDNPVLRNDAPHSLTSSFSFIDAAGVPHTGSLSITYHFYLTRGSGRGGGGGGWKMMLDGGTINLQ